MPRYVKQRKPTSKGQFPQLYPNLHRFLQATKDSATERQAHDTILRHFGAGSGKAAQTSGQRQRNSKMAQGRGQRVGLHQGNGRGYLPGRQGRNERSRAYDSIPLVTQAEDGRRVLHTDESQYIRYVNKEGVVLRSKLHNTLRSFKQAGVPVAEGHKWYGSDAHEYHFIKDGRQAVRVHGQQFLTTIEAGSEPPGIGNRFRHGVIPVSPSDLGGRLEVLATVYQEHKAMSFSVHYAPTVPSTTTGAIAIFFQNDIGIQTDIIALEEFVHASNNEHFVETQVWEEVMLDISPENMIVKYADEESGDFRLETQGLIQVISASNVLPVNTSLGNLFIRYDFEFYAAELDFEIDDVTEMAPVLNKLAVSYGTIDGMPVRFPVATAAGAGIFFELPSPYQATDMPNYLFVGVLSTGTIPTDFTWATRDDTASRTFGRGQCIWFRFLVENSTVYAIPFVDMASASAVTTTDGSGTSGQCYWNNEGQANVDVGNLAMYGRLIRLGNTS